MEFSIFRSLVLLAASVMIIPGIAGAKTESTTVIETISLVELTKSNDFRENYGFEKRSDNNKAIYANGSKEKYGVYLSDEELQVMSKREKTINEGRKLQQKIVETYGESFGGLYYDHLENNGKLKVALVNETVAKDRAKDANNIENVRKLIATSLETSEIETYYVNYSLQDLINIQKEVVEYIKQNKLFDIYTEISVPENKIIIQLNESEQTLAAELGRKFEKDALKFIVGGSEYRTQSRTTYTRPLAGGYAISNTTLGNICTAAFTGWWNGPIGKENVVVTAGHCGNLYNSISQGGAFIGYVNNVYFQGTSDALLIGVGNGATTVSADNYNTGAWESVETISSEVLGQTVCKSGYTTDITCGPLKSAFASGSPAGYNTYLTGLRSVACHSAEGDSGSPTYIPGEFGSDRLTGVLSGGNMVGTEERMLYSHVENVKNNLNLSGIYTDSIPVT